MTDKRKEKIRFNTEIIKILTLSVIATGGGTVSLIVSNLETAIDELMAVTGMILSMVFGILAIFVYRQTKRLIK